MKKPIIGVTVGTPISTKKIEEDICPAKTVNGNGPDKNGNVEVCAGNASIVSTEEEMSAILSNATEIDMTKKFFYVGKDGTYKRNTVYCLIGRNQIKEGDNLKGNTITINAKASNSYGTLFASTNHEIFLANTYEQGVSIGICYNFRGPLFEGLKATRTIENLTVTFPDDTDEIVSTVSVARNITAERPFVDEFEEVVHIPTELSKLFATTDHQHRSFYAQYDERDVNEMPDDLRSHITILGLKKNTSIDMPKSLANSNYSTVIAISAFETNSAPVVEMAFNADGIFYRRSLEWGWTDWIKMLDISEKTALEIKIEALAARVAALEG